VNEIWEMRQTIHVVALSRLHIRQLARLRLCVVQVDMQHGVIVLVLRAPEVLHAQTLGGNMLSRDTPPPLGKMGGLRVGKIYKKICVCMSGIDTCININYR
jgi:hypothetical protein